MVAWVLICSLIIFQKGRKKQPFNEIYSVRVLLTTIRMGKIYETLPKEFNIGQEIRFTSKCRLILLGKLIQNLSCSVEWRNLNSTSAKQSRGVGKAKQVQVCNELQQQNELVPLWDHTVMHKVTQQGVMIFVYQFWFDCNWIRFFILRKNLIGKNSR